MNAKVLTVLFAMVLLLAACAQQPSSQGPKSPIVIGAIMPLTGDAAAYGTPLQQVAEIAREEINNAGGIDGRELRIIYEDGKCDAKGAATAAQKLIEIDNVDFILGGLCSGETLGAAPAAEAAKVVLFSAASGSPDITNAGDYIFRNFPSDATSGGRMAEYANKNYAKVALLVETTDYAQALAKVFRSKYTGEIVADESYASDQADFKTQLAKMKAASPDAVYIVPQTPQKFGIVLKQKAELGLDVPLLTNEFAAADDILKGSAAEIEGAVYAEPAFDPDSPAAQQLFNKIKSRHGELSGALPPVYFATMYDAVYIAKEAMTQGTDAETVKAYLYSVKGRQGVAGTLSIDQNGDAVLEYVLRTVRNGKATVLQDS